MTGGECRGGAAFGAALRRLVCGLRAGAATDDLVAACEASMAALPVRTLADAAGVLAVELAALEAEGPGKVWRIAAVGSVRDLLADLAQAGAAAALLPAGADQDLQQLQAGWLALVADVDAAGGEDLAATRAAWSALLDLADAAPAGLSGILVKLQVLLRLLDDTAADPEAPERRLLTSTIAAVEQLEVRARAVAGHQVDNLLMELAGKTVVDDEPAPSAVAAGAKAAGISLDAATMVYRSMVSFYRQMRGVG
ncbi:hypothetical protein [Azospirillum picis]|uniref:Uncharacterized protein n=1 Tax=Azospirillum picis TaxID=488438 RepID=A0ABU0MUS3_9PROT|nr:hypothetical protein [Azospirillum picis]MBP2303347.1 hypothetical protein [Azospirillum picis]MDQ0537171.1 hypothetical protein [Azospirillum picis]